MIEKNRESLQKAINALPQYQPKEQIWDAIVQDLHVAESEQPLQNAIKGLEQYEPPAFLWEAITEELESPTVSNRQTRIIWLRSAAAAVILLTSGFLLWYSQQDAPAKEEIVYTEVQDALFTEAETNLNNDEEEFEVVLAMFNESIVAQHEKEPNTLKEELELLNEEKAMLEEAKADFGADADLELQLAEIERAREKVLKQLASFI